MELFDGFFFSFLEALEDAEKSTQLDPSNIKGHLLTG
jgi:hypothetical protein